MPQAMVVDDSKAIRVLLSRTLAEIGYEVCQAADGVEALSVLKRNESVSLILVDWNMPNMCGLEFVQKLRSNPRYSSIVLIMVTTETEVEQMIKAVEAGANEYVMKPFTKDIIADKLRLLGVMA